MSDNWVVQNLQRALDTWNEKLAEIWTLLLQSPEEFKNGKIWSAGNWNCFAGAVFSCWHHENIWKPRRDKKTGAGGTAVPAVYSSERSRYLWLRIDARDL